MVDFLDTENVFESLANVQQLTKEAQEVVDARKRHTQTTQELFNEQLQLREDIAEHTEASSKTSAEILTGMQNKMDRVEEIESNPFLRVMEPVVGKFSPNFSREKLMRDVGTDETRLKIKGAEDDIAIQDAQRKVKDIELRKAKADAELIGEQADVDAIANVIAAQSTEVDTKNKFANLILTIGSEDQIASAQAEGLVTDEQVKQAKRTRQSTDVASASEKIHFEALKRQDRDAKMTQMTDEQLRQASDAGTLPARVVKEEQGRRVNFDTAVAQQQSAFLLAKSSEEELDALAKSGTAPGVTETTVGKEKQKREDASAKLAQDKASIAVQQERLIQAQQGAENRIVVNMSRNELIDAKAQLQAQDGAGDVIIKDRESKDVTLTMTTIDTVSNRLKVLDTVLLEDSQVAAIENEAQIGVRAATKALSRMLNIDVPPDAAPLVVLEEINKVGGFSSDQQVVFQAGIDKLNMAVNDLQDDVTARAEFITQANDQIQAATKAAIDDELSRHSKAVQPALKSYYQKGVVSSQQDALNIIAIEHQEATGVPAYDASLQIASQLILTGEQLGAAEDEATKLSRLFADKDISTPERLAGGLATVGPSAVSAIHQQMAQPIVAAVIPEAWAQAADDLQLPAVAEGIRNGTLGRLRTGEFQELILMESLREQEVDVSSFTNAVRRRSHDVASKLFNSQATGNKHIIASVDKLLFNNNLDTFVSQWIDDGILQANLGKFNEQKQKQDVRDRLVTGNPARRELSGAIGGQF